MNRRTSISVDVLFMFATANAIISFASWFTGNGHAQLYSAIWGCFCLLMAVLLCVYPRGGGR
jgi:hypothetical protein